jgi:signal transduction histidine kinase/DNA-binding response OmpR family regulator
MTSSGIAESVLAGGGEMGTLMRALDWSSTAVGPVEQWPQSLKTAVSMLLESRFPMYIAWGPDYTQFYNDAYRPILGATKHPAALGRSSRYTFAEVWEQYVGPLFGRVMEHAEPTYIDDWMLPLDRYGFVEECYFTFCYSAIRNETGDVGGVFVTVVETTARVFSERRVATLRELAAVGAKIDGAAKICELTAATLAASVADTPFALLYMLDDAGRTLSLAGSTGFDFGSAAAPRVVNLAADLATDDGRGWPLAAAIDSRDVVLVDDLHDRFDALPPGPWPESPRAALVMPLALRGEERPYGVIVTGLSPRIAFDDHYRGYLDLVAGQIATALASARAYEEERRRAAALAEIDRAKTAFFSNVSHEFRTPLTLMLGPTEDLLEGTSGPVTQAQREQLALIHRNELRLLRLVNTLLEFSRIEAGRVRAVYRPTDLSAYTAELASSFRSAIERAGLNLVVAAPDLREQVYVDPEMWEKIVLNLISNALKHTFEGRITVTVAASAGHAVLMVRDTGVGIPATEVPRLFERFHRVPNARSRTHEGSGIGLALVQELVQLHGGDIEVESEEGKGSTFTVRIPLGAAHLPHEHVSDARAPVAHSADGAAYVEETLRWLPDDRGPHQLEDGVRSASASPGDSPAQGRILLADDNADVRDYVGRLLRDQGWHVEAVADGAAALAAARATRPDLVLSDVMMPVLDGFELLRALRAGPDTSTIPVILLSARAGEESRIEGLDAGADDYMVKPFSARELVARVSAHLSLSTARARASAEVEASHAALSAVHERLQEQARATEAALAALRVEQSRMTHLFRQAPAFIAVLRGPEHVFELSNDAYDQLLGNRELIGRPVREAVPEAEGQGYFELLDAVLESGQAVIGQETSLVLQRTSGAPPEQRLVNFLYQAMVEADGSRSGVFVHGVDVTTQVRAREEAESARADAEAANQAKSDFLAAMSHELRTPLNAIGGYAQLIDLGVHGPVTAAQHTALARIQDAEKHLLSLINDVLNFAKMEAGRVEYDVTEIELADVVANIAPMIEPQLAGKGLGYEVSIAPGTRVQADQDKLQQILLNLLSNAIKFTDTGGTIVVDTGARDGMSADVTFLRVTDSGIGIPRDKLDMVFDPFVQVHRNLTRSTEGTGLGLAISRDLARGMGGDVRVRSEPGVGSTFTISLRTAADDVSVAHRTPTPH